jgi:hypothetical protein
MHNENDEKTSSESVVTAALLSPKLFGQFLSTKKKKTTSRRKKKGKG